MSLAGIAIVAAVAVLALLAAVEFIAWAAKVQSFVATVVLGHDGRTSTSKTFILLWTLLVGWALIALLIAGEFVSTHACVPPSDIANAAQKCKAAADEVGLLQVGWLHFLHAGLSGSYLVLLGVPAAAGIAAKGITQSQVTGTGFKAPRPPEGFDPLTRIAEVFSADDGSTDIGDFQYLIFNLVTAAYFVSQFLNPDGSGLPTIPDTLLGLTSVSAGLYVGKKAVTRTQPTVTGVFPLPLHDGQQFTVIGTDLTADPASPTPTDPQVTIDGVPAIDVVAVGTNLCAKAPPNVGSAGSPVIRHLRVLNPYGGISSDFPVQCL
ncbi:MAG: hypothetical protein ACRDNK_05735 [Solirubrobacteraceae bacterium]